MTTHSRSTSGQDEFVIDGLLALGDVEVRLFAADLVSAYACRRGLAALGYTVRIHRWNYLMKEYLVLI